MSTTFDNLLDRTAALMAMHAARMAVLERRVNAGVCDCGDPSLCPYASKCFEQVPYPFPPDAMKETNAES